MTTTNILSLVRNNIRSLTPYSSARHEYKGKASVLLDANENAFGSPAGEFNRYPDPLQWQLKSQLSGLNGVPAENIFIGNGSDEVIDLAYRIFCDPGKDNVIICPPTYGMYEVSGNINDVEVRKVNLTPKFELDREAILQTMDARTKLLFICSPNNPTGNCMNRESILALLQQFNGIILIDEAYINYATEKTFVSGLINYPNLVVMQTLSKAWGMAALRLGICYASREIISLFNKVKPPYNIDLASQEWAIQGLGEVEQVNAWTTIAVAERIKLQEELVKLTFIKKVYESDANFLLVKCIDAEAVYNYLCANEIVVRNRSREPGCEGCLRITVGTPGENNQLINLLNQYNGK